MTQSKTLPTHPFKRPTSKATPKKISGANAITAMTSKIISKTLIMSSIVS